MTGDRDTAPPTPEVFRLDPRLPLMMAAVSGGMILFGVLADLEDGFDVAFAGVGLLFGLGCIPWALYPFAVLHDDHLKVGRQVFKYRDILAVEAGATTRSAAAILPRHTQPYLLIQTRQSAAPHFVRVAVLRGGAEGQRARLWQRVREARDQPSQAAPFSNTASN